MTPNDWAILMSIILLVWVYRSARSKKYENEIEELDIPSHLSVEQRKEAIKRELKRQGYTDELITIVLPIIDKEARNER